MIQYKKDIIAKLRSFGHYPIAITCMMYEDTFVFETEEEAKASYIEMEKTNIGDNKVQGWWYSWKKFLKALDDHKRDFGHINKIEWTKDVPIEDL